MLRNKTDSYVYTSSLFKWSFTLCKSCLGETTFSLNTEAWFVNVCAAAKTNGISVHQNGHGRLPMFWWVQFHQNLSPSVWRSPPRWLQRRSQVCWGWIGQFAPTFQSWPPSLSYSRAWAQTALPSSRTPGWSQSHSRSTPCVSGVMRERLSPAAMRPPSKKACVCLSSLGPDPGVGACVYRHCWVCPIRCVHTHTIHHCCSGQSPSLCNDKNDLK